MTRESSPLLSPSEESVETEHDTAPEWESESGKARTDLTSEPDFVCDCDVWMRSACAGHPFFEAHDGKRYCVLHHPSPHKARQFDEALQRKLASSNSCNWRGVWFPERVDFAGFEFDSDADFTGAIFNMDATFSGAKFNRSAHFTRATFNGIAVFDSSRYIEDTSYCNARFNQETTFHGVSFGAAADFSKTAFENSAVFSAVTFGALSIFGSVAFGGFANFHSAQFRKDVFFNSAVFRSTANASFESASFDGVASFISATFGGETYFSSATFRSRADFNSSTFAKNLHFSLATFQSKGDFSSATFQGDAYFSHSEFREDADFRKATFANDAYFSGTLFNDRLSFSGTVNERSLKDGGRLSKRALGLNTSVDFQYTRFGKPPMVSFHTLALRPFWFVNVDSRGFVFTDVRWNWDGLTIRKEIEALTKKGVAEPHRLLVITCRQLAENSEANHRYEEASRFRYWAMELARQTKWRHWTFWKTDWLHLLYWAVSGYGEKIGRAFACLALLLITFALLYTQVGFTTPQTRSEAQAAHTVIATEPDRIGQPLSINSVWTYSLAVMSLQKPDPKPLTGTAQTLVLLETILGPLQAALLALAIRRKFMR
jgi:pentapeptide repeat protein